MYWNAESVTVDDDEGRFTLVIEDVEGERVTVNIHGIDLDAFYDQVKARIGPYLREMHEAKREYDSGMLRHADGAPYMHVASYFACNPDESGGAARDAYDGYPDESGYHITDPKHPDFHSIHADIWDARDGK